MVKNSITVLPAAIVAALLPLPVAAASLTLFSTGNPDGRIATLSRPGSPGLLETETADDFILGQTALVNGASFIGLVPAGTPVTAIKDVEIELYKVFPTDSANPPDGRVPTRVNSPADTQFAAFDQANGDITVSATILNPSFSAANSVINGINALPNQTTGGEGAVSGEEILITVLFNKPFLVFGTDHDFFRPEVQLSSGNFLWLSAPKPIVSPGTPFTPDLQAWIRNTNLNPDWLRIGTDIVGGSPAPTFNMTFSLAGDVVPEPSTMLLLGMGLAGVFLLHRRRAA